jgi:hypothetical protein
MKIRKPIIQLFSILCLALLVVAPQASHADFKIVVIGDVQNHQSGLSSLTSSIVSMSDVAFVAQMGDVSNNCTTGEYNVTDPAFDLLITGAVKVPYGVVPGNHDSCSTFENYYGISRWDGSTSPVYPAGYYKGSLDNRNHYFFFSADGMDFIIFFLQYSPTAAVFTWANNLMAANVSRRAIVVSHNILNYNDAWVNQTTYTSLSANPNLFLMLCGHMHAASDGEALRTETRTSMDPVHIIMTDYQDMGSNMLRTLTFSPASDTITVQHVQGTGSTLYLTYNMTVSVTGDFTGDCDVDGSDLAALIAGQYSLDLSTFAGNYGKNACQ